MLKILIADDDNELCELLSSYLTQEGFEINTVFDGQEAVIQTRMQQYDLLILDVMMPMKNGFDVLTEVRQYSQLPVIMLTAKGEKLDRIVGLEMGADDYIAKPCDPRELVARIRAIFRRTSRTSEDNYDKQSTMIEVGDLCMDSANREVKLSESIIDLTSTEFDLLKLLVTHAGSLVSREKISEECLGKKLQPFDRSIDMHLSNVRKKLGPYSSNKERIKTVRGSGYQYLVWNEK